MDGANYPSLRGKPVLITGGGSGIGESLVRNFWAQAARVAFLDIARAPSERLVEELSHGPHAPPLFEPCDLTDIAALRDAMTRVHAALGPVRVLVNNAAHDDRHAIDDVTPEYWDDRIAVNLRHQFFAAQAVYKPMAAAGGGSIVNFGSVSWKLAQGGMPVYLSAKAAVEGLTRGLARDFGPLNIRVNTVMPGWIMTERQKKLWLTPQAEAETLARQCLKRMLGPADVAPMVLFLASDDAAGCTSQTFVVDGGLV
ncbi:MAG: SDR family oxidoreductase [Alphaproteobacteria bacterium]|nr:SDR family oxidoreductase [Alphaproteobacteria bacterium]